MTFQEIVPRWVNFYFVDDFYISKYVFFVFTQKYQSIRKGLWIYIDNLEIPSWCEHEHEKDQVLNNS